MVIIYNISHKHEHVPIAYKYQNIVFTCIGSRWQIDILVLKFKRIFLQFQWCYCNLLFVTETMCSNWL